MPLRVHADPMPHSHRLRHGRVREPGRAYLCTTVVRERIRVFTDWRRGRLLVNALRWQDSHGHTNTIAFVIMPDHLHWLLALTGTRPLSRVMHSVKRASSRAINAAAARSGPLWQDGFHDHALRREEDLRETARE